MISIILSFESVMHSSVSSSLLLIPSSVFFISVIVFLISDWFYFIFSSSVLKFSLCSLILFPSSVSILITNALNSLYGTLFIFVSLHFSGSCSYIGNKFLCLRILFTFSDYLKLVETVTYPGLERVSFCGSILM